MSAPLKRCTRCGIEQALAFFDRCRRDGYSSWCKRCRLEGNRRLRMVSDVVMADMSAREKARHTERCMTRAFSRPIALAIHRMAFAPHALRPGDLDLASEAIAQMLKNHSNA